MFTYCRHCAPPNLCVAQSSPVIAREKLIAKLRELGYRFKKDQWRVSLFANGVKRAQIQKKDFLEEQTIRQVLRRMPIED